MSPLSQEQIPPTPSVPLIPPIPPSPPMIQFGGPNGVTTIELPARPMTARDIAALRARRSELSTQLESATSRRNGLAARLEKADGISKAGLEQRVSLLDNRILQLETDLAETGRLLASAPAGLTAAAGVPTPFGLNPGQITGISVVSIIGITCVALPIALAIARNIWRRGSRRVAAAVAPESAERMERLEQAVDAIAIEIERISEGQRFVTRLLTDGGAPALAVGQRAAEPVRLPERETLRASRESA